ncbi:kinesin-like protein KIF20B isoform X2 [Phyllobates terribilis]|uniref:kinesin-like protein KIF20B isoform X2 n=1 Tax=Phyllobates terribilis TaxID=111132 RepID=UPI003CCB6093
MKPSEDSHPPPRPSYLGEGITYPERGEPQSVDDIRTNLSERFLSLEDSVCATQKSSLDAKEPMQVFLRIRPFTGPEIEQRESQDCVSIPDPCSVLVKAPLSSQACRLSDKGSGSMAQKFTFTHVFGPETTQSQFFDGTLKKQVIDFMKGQSRLIFTYGVTNAGKTFTFQGTKVDAGILPRSMEMLFNAIEGKVYSKMDIKPHRCRDYIRLTKEQVRAENAFKNGVLRHTKEVDPQCTIRSNNRTSEDTTVFLNDEAAGLPNSSRVLSEFEERVRECEEFKLDVDGCVKFSVWVSFCEIYNECIYDLLDPVTGEKSYKRKTLRLAQDIKGFSFVKDLQWIQVSDAREACRVLSLGKKFQSIAFTKLNSSSSRSHSIFTVRLLKIEDADVPRVVKVSELTLCDLAGSERCTKTQNEGERLKESGNINTSLLILGKCINALKNSQLAKFQQHVPFRESKLTHYLQSFFTGKGKVCMIVNISQAASAYDETLNVLKFSAVAQKVLILDSSQALENLSLAQRKSAREVSFIINNADSKRLLSRKRATVQWESRLDDVVEDGGDDDGEEYVDTDDEDPLDCTNLDEPDEDELEEDEIIIKKEAYEKLLELVEDLKTKLVSAKRDKLLMELKIREEVAKEFTEHFMQRENDFGERLQKEKELLEERCDERMEIFQDLVRKCSNEEEEDDEEVEEGTKEPCSVTEAAVQADELSRPLQGFFSSMQSDLAVIKKQAVEAHHHIAAIHDDPEEIAALEQKCKQVTSDLSEVQEELKRKSADLARQMNQYTETRLQLEESEKALFAQKQRMDQLIDMSRQQDSVIDKLKDLISHWEAKCEDYEKTLNSLREEMAQISSDTSRKRPPVDHHSPEDQPPLKKDFVDPNDNRLKSEGKHTDAMQSRAESPILRELEDVKVEKENYKVQTVKLAQSVAELEEQLAGYEKKLIDLESKYKSVDSELQIQKDLTLSMEGTINMLKQEVDQNQLNIANKVAQIKTIQSKLEDFGKTDPSPGSGGTEFFNLNDLIEESTKRNLGQIGGQVGKMPSGRESAFYNAIEGLWKKCQDVLHESSKKNKRLLQFEKQLDDLKREMSVLQNEKESDVSSQVSVLKEKDELIVQLREQLAKHLESLKIQEIDYKNQLLSHSQQIKDLRLLADSYKEKSEKLSSLEDESKEKSVAIETLEKRLAELQAEHMGCEKKQKELNDEKSELEQKIRAVREERAAAETTANEKEKLVKESVGDVALLKKELLQKDSQLKTAQLDLQRKEEDYVELKDKLADAKKQMLQVEKEISAMREEKKTLTNKITEYEKLKKQMSSELEIKQRTIQQLGKEHRDYEKTDNTTQLYQKACEDVKAKEKLIEDMKLTLVEQEQTQEEQELALEAKTEEAEKLAGELELWKQKYREKISGKENVLELSRETNNNSETSNTQAIKLQNRLQELEEKCNNDKKKWFEERKTLIAQAKESESQRNREMRKFADDRERYGKQQAELDHLSAQLAEKDDTLQKWREERDTLLSALEVQLKNLLSSIAEKEKEIEILKNSNRGDSLTPPDSLAVEELKRQLVASEATIKEYQDQLAKLEHSQSSAMTAAEKVDPRNVMKSQDQSAIHCQEKKSSTSSGADSASDIQSQDGSDVVLDSSMISTENGKTSRFPQPQMEIRFSPVKPNKMEIKHRGDDSPVTVKISRPPRKRKSTDMEQDPVKIENRKNTRNNKMTPSFLASPAASIYSSKKQSLKKQPSTSSTASTQKKDGTLQKLGEFLQSSPSIFQTKAKKFLETIGAPKTTGAYTGRNADESKPKKSRRKLYTTEISAPLDIPAHAIIMDKNERESDHLIMKRRLRTRTAK